MGRSTEQSYKTVANYLRQRKLPATVNDMIEANILSRATVYKLFRPEMFSEAALFGIKPLNDTKPFFFGYDASLQLEMLNKINPEAAKIVSEHREVMTMAAEKVAANSTVLDPDERLVVERFRAHKENNDHVDFMANFTTGVMDVDAVFNTLSEMREPVGDSLDKIRTVLISMFMKTFNTGEAKS